MIIDKSYFKGSLYIPNVQESITPLGDRTGFQVNLDEAIVRFEKKLLTYALGYEAYNLFIGIFEPDGSVSPGAEQRWVDLVSGKEYTDPRGSTVKWEGLRYSLGAFNYSLIADYVFAMFLNENSRTFGSAGMQREEPRGGSAQSSIPRVVEAWNEFVRKYQGEVPVYGAKTYFDAGWIKGVDYYGSDQSGEVSLYKFIEDNKETYPEVQFQFFGKVNSFGI